MSMGATADKVLEPARRNWLLLLALGLLMVVFGTIGLFQPVAYTVAAAIFFGALLVVSGGVGVVTAFRLEGWGGRIAAVLIALLYIAAGAILFAHPVLGAIKLTFVVALFLIATGVVKVWMAFGHRNRRGWGWIVASGALSVVLGGMILGDLPGAGLWVLGLFIAIEMVFDGWGLIMLALASRFGNES